LLNTTKTNQPLSIRIRHEDHGLALPPRAIATLIIDEKTPS
jgi:hypothetical protein